MYRYIYIICLKNPAAFNDDFWCRFISLWITLASLLLQGAFQFLADYQTMPFYMCAGIKPVQSLKKSSTMTGVVEIASAIIILAVSLKIYIHKKKLTVQGTTDVNEIEKHSLTGLASIFFVICFLGSLATMLVILNKSKPEDLSKFPYFVMCYYRSLISPTMFIIFLVLVCVFNNKYLQIVLDEFGALKN